MSVSRRRYDREFKLEAVRLATHGNIILIQVARELGINMNILPP